MASYTLDLLIDASILALQSDDNLCISKKVGGEFTTVFQDASIRPKRDGQKNLLTSNTFNWQDKFRVFATVQYKHGMLVQSATNEAEIQFGEQTNYENSHFSDAAVAPADKFENSSGPQSPDDTFLANNVPNTLHVGVQILSGSAWSTIYVDPSVHNGSMDHQLTPLNEYMLFWSQKVQTDSMIDQSKFPNPFIWSFTGSQKTKKVRYGYKVADKPTPGENANFYNV